MGSSNKTVTLFFFIFCLNLLFSSGLVAAGYYNPTATPPPPSTPGTPSTDGGPVTCIGSPSPPTGGAPTCPLDILSLGTCVNLFNGTIPIRLGRGVAQCCTLVQGLVDVEANLCLCAAIKASPLRIIRLYIPIAFDLLVGACGRGPPTIQCA